MNKILSDRLKKLRANREISQAKLAKILNMSQTTIAAWETGRSEPDSETLIKLALFFDVTVDYIIGASNEIIKPAKPPKEDYSGAYGEPRRKTAYPKTEVG
jgi:transcriptional regulator with XRE-family HTH domain